MSTETPSRTSTAELNGHAEPAKRPGSIPPAPEDVGGPGMLTWKRAWAEPHISEADYDSVARLARLEDEAADLRDVVREEGVTLKRPIQNARGQVIGEEAVPHPNLGQLRRLGGELTALSRQLGLTPMARARRPANAPNAAHPTPGLGDFR